MSSHFVYSVHCSYSYFVFVASNYILLKNCEFHLLTDDEINALLSLVKLFPGLKKLKNTGSDFVVNVAEVSHYTAFMHVITVMVLKITVIAVQISIEVPGRHIVHLKVN